MSSAKQRSLLLCSDYNVSFQHTQKTRRSSISSARFDSPSPTVVFVSSPSCELSLPLPQRHTFAQSSAAEEAAREHQQEGGTEGILWSHRQHLSLMNIQRSTPIHIHTRHGRSRHKSHDFEELSCLRSTESNQSFSPNLGSPSPPETPDSSHCISRIGDYLLLEPLEGDHVFRAAHLHSGEELVCKVGTTR